VRGRGLDFEQRFRTSRWAEDLLLTSLNRTAEYVAVRFGLSEVRSSFGLAYDKSAHKEPDLLVYRRADLSAVEARALEGSNLAREDRASFGADARFGFAVRKALAAIEVEFSPYRASEMKGRHWLPKSPAAWERRPLKNATPPTAPNIWVKEEDLGRLEAWQATYRVPIAIVHLFDQEAFAVSLAAIAQFNHRITERAEEAVRLQMTEGIFKKVQTYDRVDAQGAAEKKVVFIVTPAAATKAGDVADVKVEAQLGLSASKKYVCHPVFSGGSLSILDGFRNLLGTMRDQMGSA
jgi:hypothetical protein